MKRTPIFFALFFALFIALILIFPLVRAAAQNPVVPYRNPRATFTTSTGQPLSGGCVFTYGGGTTTPQATYTDYTGGTPNANPVILDATGSAVMWLGVNTYKFEVYSYGGTNCASGSLQWTVDQVPGDAFLNGTISGATITNPAIGGGTMASTALSGVTIVSSSIDSTPIGSTSPAAAAFTQLSAAVNQMSFSATPVFAAGSYDTFTMTLTGNVTSSTSTGGAIGKVINFSICQNGTGGYTLAWPANFVNAPPMPSNISACMTPQFFYDGANWNYLNYTGISSAAAYDAVTWSPTPVFAVDPYYIFALTLAGNVTGPTLTGANAGQVISLNLCQNGTGGYTFVWPGSFANPPNMPLAANACITPQFFNNGTSWFLLGQTTAESPQAVTSTPTPAFDANGYNQFSMTLGNSVTSSTLSGGYFGEPAGFSICQNTTGGYSFTWPVNLLNAPVVTPTPSACTNVIAIYNGTNWLTAASQTTSAATGALVNCLSTTNCVAGVNYASGATYTNTGTLWRTEYIVMTGSGGCTGADSSIQGYIDGTLVAANGFDNSCGTTQGKGIAFDVPPGATFEGLLTHIDGGGTYTIADWTEVAHQ